MNSCGIVSVPAWEVLLSKGQPGTGFIRIHCFAMKEAAEIMVNHLNEGRRRPLAYINPVAEFALLPSVAITEAAMSGD